MDLDNDQINEAYQAIVAQNAEFVAQLAKAAIDSSTDVLTDMWADDQNRPVPTVDDVREHAKNFTEDMLRDFGDNLLKAIANQKFDLKIRLKPFLKFDG